MHGGGDFFERSRPNPSDLMSRPDVRTNSQDMLNNGRNLSRNGVDSGPEATKASLDERFCFSLKSFQRAENGRIP